MKPLDCTGQRMLQLDQRIGAVPGAASLPTAAWALRILPIGLPTVPALVQLLIIDLLVIQSQYMPLQLHPFLIPQFSATLPTPVG